MSEDTLEQAIQRGLHRAWAENDETVEREGDEAPEAILVREVAAEVRAYNVVHEQYLVNMALAKRASEEN